MSYIQFYNVDQPERVLLAVETKQGFVCQLPYVENGILKTIEHKISKNSMAHSIQRGRYKVVSINGFTIEALDFIHAGEGI